MCYAFKIYGEKIKKTLKLFATQVVVGQISSLGHIKIERLQGREILMTLSDCSI